ncbi:hypothetical protein BAUCODRAFT_387133 [Baudoinia panamericana UAMH 10762]|uniref:Uncharacterized protein n=1 Tax=Baudoinia panamericana (strain UAMH 10762) TaxID=717646 RepID=M2NI30_BAUPA|nr:uncharacterized protein BAUCODRAFT_387133 [Baudoinia panamericana UAMH 10762]EMC98999.1 hypothetical protein BAUCODRAFT_387133 [Baudoinia panamericana UAMH 10762]
MLPRTAEDAPTGRPIPILVLVTHLYRSSRAKARVLQRSLFVSPPLWLLGVEHFLVTLYCFAFPYRFALAVEVRDILENQLKAEKRGKKKTGRRLAPSPCPLPTVLFNGGNRPIQPRALPTIDR